MTATCRYCGHTEAGEQPWREMWAHVKREHPAEYREIAARSAAWVATFGAQAE